MAKVIVTGGAGFIGRSVVKLLLNEGHEVRILDNLSRGAYNKIGNEELIKVDLLNNINLIKFMQGADYCIHLAAKIGGVGYLKRNGASILSENANMLTAVFNGSIKSKVRRIIYASSSMVYESANKFPSRESDLNTIPMPKTSYGFSKLVGEFYCKAYFDQYGLNYTIIRPFNAYGPGELPADEPGLAHVIPDLLKKVFYGKTPIEILGNGRQIRCFTHVDDIARAIVISMGHKKSLNQDFNVAAQNPIRIDDLLKLIWRISGKKSKLKIKHLKSLDGDVQKRVPDVTKAYKFLNWKPEHTLESGLSNVVSWFLENYQEPSKHKI